MNSPMERFDAGIVFVDDEPEILEILEARFTGMTERLQTFTDPRQALDFSRNHPMDVLVTDLKMPGMDGLTLFQEARKVHPGLVGIFLSGFGDKAAVQGALKLGAFDFIDKPFNDKVLVACVKRAMEKAQSDRLMRSILELFVKTNTQLDPLKFDQLSPDEQFKTLKAALGVAKVQIENLRNRKA